MSTLAPEPTHASRWSLKTSTDRGAVLAQLDAIANSVYFRSSKRYPSFLRFVVEEELSGRGSELKERTIGIEVFGRDAAYDTNEDPIVRVAAAEVRKRLANYYADATHKNELRIWLSIGSYDPTFHKPSNLSTDLTGPAEKSKEAGTLAGGTIEAVPDATEKSNNLVSQKLHFMWLCVACFACVALVSTFAVLRYRTQTPADQALTAIWHPITEFHSTILASMGPVPMFDPTPSPSQPSPETNLLDAVRHYDIVPLVDAIALSRLSAFLAVRNIQLRVMNADVTSFDDVQSGPTILIGGFSNQWTLRLTSKLHFTFEDSPTISRILDHQAKVQPDWVLHRDRPYSSLVQDYAIVARFHDSTTGNMTLIGAGIGPNGTLAAVNFLTDGDDLARLLAPVPRKDWEHAKVEAVIGTQVINGKSGPPQIIAASYW